MGKAALTKYTGAAPKAQEAKPAASAGSGSVDLTAENFASSVGNGNWFVKFYAPWCGHCKAMAQTWEDLANAQKDSNPKVNIASVDCTQHNDVCKEHGVKGFPTLLFFQNGKNLGKHQGGRDRNHWSPPSNLLSTPTPLRKKKRNQLALMLANSTLPWLANTLSSSSLLRGAVTAKPWLQRGKNCRLLSMVQHLLKSLTLTALRTKASPFARLLEFEVTPLFNTSRPRSSSVLVRSTPADETSPRSRNSSRERQPSTTNCKQAS